MILLMEVLKMSNLQSRQRCVIKDKNNVSNVALTGPLHSHLKLLTAGLKTYEIPPDFSGNSPFCQPKMPNKPIYIAYIGICLDEVN